jgi:hypothetical protein
MKSNCVVVDYSTLNHAFVEAMTRSVSNNMCHPITLFPTSSSSSGESTSNSKYVAAPIDLCDSPVPPSQDSKPVETQSTSTQKRKCSCDMFKCSMKRA